MTNRKQTMIDSEGADELVKEIQFEKEVVAHYRMMTT